MDIYKVNLSCLLGICGVLFIAQRKPSQQTSKQENGKKTASKKAGDGSGGDQMAFLVVYCLVMGSDWLQGPFLYSLYRDEHSIPSSLVSTLFTTGFLAGAVSAYFIGAVADTYGRKRACLGFCAVYAASCFLTCIPSVPLLFAGRALGGVATSLLFTVFDSWMVTDFHARGLAARGADLGRTFGTMSMLNSCVAIASGLASEWLVAATGTRKAPFVASAGLLAAAAWVIGTQWTENYGTIAANTKPAGKDAPKMAASKLRHVFSDPLVLALGLASTMFEGSMYLFVFFWGPALRSVQTSPGELPYGIIFASFMAAVLAASLAFTLVTDRKLVSYTGLLLGLLAVSELAFYVMASPWSEQSAFWLFCAFEACVGVYWPSMGYLKGKLIDDGVRAQVYGFLRIPLNIFVVVSLLLTGDGDAFGPVFSNCSKLLLAACGGILAMMLNESNLP